MPLADIALEWPSLRAVVTRTAKVMRRDGTARRTLLNIRAASGDRTSTPTILHISTSLRSRMSRVVRRCEAVREEGVIG